MSTPRPGSLFHGTSVELAPGTVLLPGRSVGRDNHPYLAGGATDRVWVTTSIAAAVAYGLEAVSSDRRRDADLHVYEVTPHGELSTAGRVTAGDFTCDRAVVVRELTLQELRVAHRCPAGAAHP